MKKPTRLQDDYRFPGFRPRSALAAQPTDPNAHVIELVRHKKKAFVPPAASDGRSVASAASLYAIWTAQDRRFTWLSTTAALPAGTAG
jgi:hypothetical protein